MKIKTQALNGASLDWAVAKCEGKDTAWVLYCLKRNGLQYSTDWSQGGPIIDRHIVSVRHAERFEKRGLWLAFSVGGTNSAMGPTPLIAAMRCYVASRLGDEVDVPDQLIEV